MNTSLIIGVFCFLLIPGLLLIGIHHLIAFILQKVYCSNKVRFDGIGIVRQLRDASIMGFAEKWWQKLWYWTFFAIRCAVCLFGFIFALGFATMVGDARSFIKNNQEMIAKYEALEYPTAQDYINALKYNKKYESTHLLATEEVGKNLKRLTK